METWQHALLEESTETRHRSRHQLRRLIVAGVVILLLAVPIGVNASHQFSDVPTSSTFHSQISTLYGARITGGCGGGKFCPNASVTRGQMAAFLVRGLGRMAGDEVYEEDDSWVNVTDGYQGVASTDLVSGGGTGGTGLVLATGSFSAWTDEAGVCPCEVQLYIVNDSTGEGSQTYLGTIGSEFAPADPNVPNDVPLASTTVTVSTMFTVGAVPTNHFDLVTKVIPSTLPSTPSKSGWVATLQTVWVPFDENGGNPTIAGDPPAATRTSRSQ
jgi:hypothetical protein